MSAVHDPIFAPPAPAAGALDVLADRIAAAEDETRGTLPDRGRVERFGDHVVGLLFPDGRRRPREALEIRGALEALGSELADIVTPLEGQMGVAPDGVCRAFLDALPDIADRLDLDARAIEAGDPAASSVAEIVLAYPGFAALAAHRVAHVLHGLGVPLVPRLMSEIAHARTGIDIHPGATIGRSFCIDHGTGVVIGETSVIGDGVKLYQGVTLGALSVAKTAAGTKRHPTIEDRVVIYANATVLGGQTVVGHDSVIGGNVWLTNSVVPYSFVYHVSQVRVRSVAEAHEPWDFVI